MKVITAKSAGFCFGVKNAVETAYKMASEAGSDERLIMLGELTHNGKVTEALLNEGFEIINDAADVPSGSKVIIRAHGVTPEQKSILADRNVTVFDCTCPFVEKIHKIVRDKAAEGKTIILTGTPGHPEVEGIRGESMNREARTFHPSCPSTPIGRTGRATSSSTRCARSLFAANERDWRNMGIG